MDVGSLSGLDCQCHISMPEGDLRIVLVDHAFMAISDFTPMMLDTNDPQAIPTHRGDFQACATMASGRTIAEIGSVSRR